MVLDCSELGEGSVEGVKRSLYLRQTICSTVPGPKPAPVQVIFLHIILRVMRSEDETSAR